MCHGSINRRSGGKVHLERVHLQTVWGLSGFCHKQYSLEGLTEATFCGETYKGNYEHKKEKVLSENMTSAKSSPALPSRKTSHIDNCAFWEEWVHLYPHIRHWIRATSEEQEGDAQLRANFQSALPPPIYRWRPGRSGCLEKLCEAARLPFPAARKASSTGNTTRPVTFSYLLMVHYKQAVFTRFPTTFFLRKPRRSLLWGSVTQLLHFVPTLLSIHSLPPFSSVMDLLTSDSRFHY